MTLVLYFFFFFSSRRRHTRYIGDWSSDVCSSDLTYPPEINGVAMTLARLVDGLRGRGHAVSVVRPRQRVDRCGPPRDAEEFLVHGAPLPGYGGLQIGLPAAGALRRHWTRHRPDVVYVATEGPLGWSAVRAATRLRLPVVSGFHTNFHSYAKHYHAGWKIGRASCRERGVR